MQGGESPACRYPPARAHLAQLVEHFHGKEGVDGSSPSVGFSVREVTINRLPLLKPRGVAPDTRCVRASGAGATNPQGGRVMLRKLRERIQSEESGFTLIELLVVILIIGILAAI